MIISHKHKFIFVAVPKTATHAIRQALRPHLGPADEEQVGLFQKSRIDRDGFRDVRHGHITAAQGQELLPAEIWQTYRKFTVVRDPVERFFSFMRFRQSDHPILQKNPLAHMKAQLKQDIQTRDLWAYPQCHFLVNQDAHLLVDCVLRLENLQADFDQLCPTLGIRTSSLNRVNETNKQATRLAVDDELLDLIAEKYRQDFEILGYPRPRIG